MADGDGAASYSPGGQSGVAVRIIPRLDIKAPNLVKTINLEGLRVVGDPSAFAMDYYTQGADELLYVDIVASLYERNSLQDLVHKTASQIFVPLTVTGGVRSIKDIQTLLRAGADKVGINTAAVRNPELIREASRAFGSQCVVLSVEAKRTMYGGKGWEIYTDGGREHTSLDAVDWIKRAVDLGAGEILLTSVDREGLQRGFDYDLIHAVAPHVPVPVIASGGAGSVDDAVKAVQAGADAVALAHILHYRKATVGGAKDALRAKGIRVRS